MSENWYVRKAELVTAEEWSPGVRPDLVLTDPKALVGLHWAHIGHQRELDGSCGIVLVDEEPVFIHRGDFIVTREGGGISVMSSETFAAKYQPAPEREH